MALLLVYVEQIAPERSKEALPSSSSSGSTGGGAILFVSSDTVPSIEEVARL
ncbi:MAG: hypothetical protein QXM89_00540 [Candidatus Bathyarchaeia archaeon]